MLRPATPLSVLLFVSFILLLLSVISTPIIKGIPIARVSDVSFGVFGYCKDGEPCSRLQVGYNTDGIVFDSDTEISLSSTARHSLSSLLIVHPIAAFFNLVALALAVAAHFHSPSHSARYLLGLLILLLPTLLITLLAFLVDILLFVPHLKWGGWIVLASTVLITSSGVVTCGMRRTLVSRKARKRRIAENAEMSGENFYARQEHEAKLAGVPAITTESKTPLVNGSPGADKLPQFATYAASRRSEDRQQTNQGDMTPVSPINEENRYYASSARSTSRPRRSGEEDIPSIPTDSYGSAVPYGPPSDGRAPNQYPPSAYGMRGGYGPPRGRGGLPPRGGFAPRGGYGPRGGMPPQGYSRGGFGPDSRGGFVGRGRGGFPGPVGAAMNGGVVARRPPPPSYPPQSEGPSPDYYGNPHGFSSHNQNSNGPYATMNENAYEPVNPSQYPATDENANNYVAYSSQGRTPPKSGSHSSRGQSPANRQRSLSPPPSMPLIGQAVEMDATSGRSSGFDSDVQGMVDLQRHPQQPGSPSRELAQEYVPVRAGWNNGNIDAQAPAHHSVTVSNSSTHRPRASSHTSGSYYEDVDPRFAESADVVPALSQQHEPIPHQTQNMHSAAYDSQNHTTGSENVRLPRATSYDELPVGARSPAESDGSHFTSVSQRGINPNWRPGHGGEFNNLGPRRPQQAKQDVLLANNPDFELLPPPARFNGRGGRAGFRGGLTEGGSRMPPPSAMAMSGDSPYPGPSTMREI